jgi:TRAP-type C4-dicarboxylate transport system permease small subunit
MYIAVACLLGIVGVVVGSVIWRYALNDAPSWSEQVALMLVINVAMFGAAAGVRDEGHIGMESLDQACYQPNTSSGLAAWWA